MQPSWLNHAGIVVPAYEAARTLSDVVLGLRETLPAYAEAIVVVDDGSQDDTAVVAEKLGCETIRHPRNCGKGAALLSGFSAAKARGWDVVLTVDADGQHPASAARDVMLASDDPNAFVIGVRNLSRDGAPRKNRFSNAISNFFLSRFAGRSLHDTQCGLRRYPLRETLALGARGRGYDFEAEVLLRAAWAKKSIVHQPIAVMYPPDRTTHFDATRDPWRIVGRVVGTAIEHGFSRKQA